MMEIIEQIYRFIFNVLFYIHVHTQIPLLTQLGFKRYCRPGMTRCLVDIVEQNRPGSYPRDLTSYLKNGRNDLFHWHIDNKPYLC